MPGRLRAEQKPDLDVFTWVHPRRSSDYCLAVEDLSAGRLAAWYGVADMIGRPERAGWGRYMRRVERQMRERLQADRPEQAAEHHGLLAELMAEHNQYLYQVRRRHDESAFGFCVCYASVFNRFCRIHWLGDCRAYLLEADRGRRGLVFRVRALTRDHNSLDAFLRERDGKTAFFRNELAERSRRLAFFLGVGDDARVRALLAEQRVELELADGACVLLVTDGFFMPLLRDTLAVSEGIGVGDLYLEERLARMLEQAADGDDKALDWAGWVTSLTREARRAAGRYPDYRDDIALLGLCRP